MGRNVLSARFFHLRLWILSVILFSITAHVDAGSPSWPKVILLAFRIILTAY